MTNTIDMIISKSMPEPNTGCWLWEGYTIDGYGYASYKGKHWLVHRLIYKEFVASPDNFNVLHKCDQPSCINPEHLFLGTQQDNVDDMIRKGRQADRKGINNPNYRHGGRIEICID